MCLTEPGNCVKDGLRKKSAERQPHEDARRALLMLDCGRRIIEVRD
jgi:hypothetical protein